MSSENLLEGYVSRAELAQQLGRNERTLIRWEEERTGPPVTRIGRKVLYRMLKIVSSRE